MKKLRKWHVVVLALLGVASLAAGSWFILQRTPPPMPKSPQEAMETFKTERFKRLPESRKQAYYEHSRELYEKLEPEQRREMGKQYRDDPEARQVMREAMMNFMLDRARDFATADAQARKDIIDGIIAMQQMQGLRRGGGDRERPRRQRQESREGETDAQREKRREDRRASRREFVQDRIEQGNPQRQAYVGEFFKALAQRRAERGLEPMSFPRRGGRRR